MPEVVSSQFGLQSGQGFNILCAAFAEAPEQKPSCIIKVYCPMVEKAGAHLEEVLRNLGTERIEIVQLY